MVVHGRVLLERPEYPGQTPVGGATRPASPSLAEATGPRDALPRDLDLHPHRQRQQNQHPRQDQRAAPPDSPHRPSPSARPDNSGRVPGVAEAREDRQAGRAVSLVLQFPGVRIRLTPTERLRRIAHALGACIDHDLDALTPEQRADLRNVPLAMLACLDEIENLPRRRLAELPA